MTFKEIIATKRRVSCSAVKRRLIFLEVSLLGIFKYLVRSVTTKKELLLLFNRTRRRISAFRTRKSKTAKIILLMRI